MGVEAAKNPLDAWIYQELLFEVRPQVLVEIGSFKGGTTLFFAHLFDLLGEGLVVSVDIDRTQFAARHERIVTVTGDSSSSDVIGQVRALCKGKRTIVVHDGDHRKGQVLADLALYAPLVTPGSYLVVEDGVIDLFRPGDGIGTFEPGPLQAVEAFVAANPDFEIDESRERYLLTYNPKGYLRRIR
jgi:cephalosporin hydroxylase